MKTNYTPRRTPPIILKRHLVFTAIILFLADRAFSSDSNTPCNLTLKAKTSNARTAQLSGVSFSAKQLNALRAHCAVKIAHLTKQDKIDAYKARLDAEEAEFKLMLQGGM